ncbi:hypothetical protein K7G98_01560 [Saccharothrix sp. MB29]|nr:hypothetical protein [Saccharothrix sp. MB29]
MRRKTSERPLTAVGVDRGDAAPRAQREHADDGVADEQVGAQSPDVRAPRRDRAVGGDEEVEHVEPLGSRVAGEPPAEGFDQRAGLRAVPAVEPGACRPSPPAHPGVTAG